MKLERTSPTLTPQEFVARWRGTQLKGRSASQSHFNDLCRVLGWPSPTDVDQEGDWYTFERGVDKTLGKSGWADVWLKGYFGWGFWTVPSAAHSGACKPPHPYSRTGAERLR